MSAFCPPKNAPSHDLVMTPEWLAKEIIAHYSPTGVVLDPCRGGGAFYDNFNSDKDWCEISEGRDFMDYKGKADWIVTNPPWSKMQPFLVRGMQVADNVVFLTTINHYTTKKRIRDMRAAGFAIREIYCVATPDKPWPQLGFQLAAVHTQRGYAGGIAMTYSPRLATVL